MGTLWGQVTEVLGMETCFKNSWLFSKTGCWLAWRWTQWHFHCSLEKDTVMYMTFSSLRWVSTWKRDPTEGSLLGSSTLFDIIIWKKAYPPHQLELNISSWMSISLPFSVSLCLCLCLCLSLFLSLSLTHTHTHTHTHKRTHAINLEIS